MRKRRGAIISSGSNTFWGEPFSSDEATMPSDLFSDRFDRIVLLGKGGFGEVWRVHDRLLGNDYALKISESPLDHEVRLLRRLGNDSFVRPFDFLSESDYHAYTMELMEDDWVRLDTYIGNWAKPSCKPEEQVLNVKAAFLVCHELLLALSALHGISYQRQDVYCHGDIKPDNLFVNQSVLNELVDVWDPEPPLFLKINDLGLATAKGGLRRRSMPSMQHPSSGLPARHPRKRTFSRSVKC